MTVYAKMCLDMMDCAGRPKIVVLRDHALAGKWKGFRDCHLEPDWVLIYEISAERLKLVRTGTHSDLEL